ncbi:hypothetical protein PORY_001155 [Pneumocystis oryctolagi]|uniref:Uncharacterized protein n=1 Tax=Pneumocystis oryctolagi TaxID=42067 RepID=A0ACB7CIJ7_9ASCO|nr:hypothetical protein PORY_001155 [Pneumocystis oryctolagi]
MDLWKTCPNMICGNEMQTVFDRAKISTLDLLMLDPIEISKKTSMTVAEVEELIEKVVKGCIPEVQNVLRKERQRFLTTGDWKIDRFLSGGIPLGHVLEIADSGTGKSQFCLQLCLTVQLPQILGGLEKEAIYISTEIGLSTKRLFEIAHGLGNKLRREHPEVDICLDGFGDRVHCITCVDLEEQDHVIHFQLPVALEKYNAGVVILDNIATHYRAEYDTSKVYSQTKTSDMAKSNLVDLVNRSRDLVKLGAHLRSLANKHQCAVIVVNQVSDKIRHNTETLWDLNYQGAWFQGWDHGEYPCKVPSLGFVWSNNIHSRILLLRSSFEATRMSPSRALRIVFSPFCAPAQIDIDIKYEGLRYVSPRKNDMSAIYKSYIKKETKKKTKPSPNRESDGDTYVENEDTSKQVNCLNGFKRIRQKVLVLSSRGITFRQRHLMKDLVDMLPHSKKDTKFDMKSKLYHLNEVAELYNCNNIMFFEARKHQDLYIWIAKAPNGPTVKFHIQNKVHTMDDLNLNGNCLKGSRPILSFDASFDMEPHTRLVKELLSQVLGVPKGARGSKPFIDHVLTFSIADNKIWFRNYQIVENKSENRGSSDLDTDISLVEIGPRFVMTIISVLEGSFGGPVIYENKEFITPSRMRSFIKKEKSNKYYNRKIAQAGKSMKENTLPIDPLGNSALFKD